MGCSHAFSAPEGSAERRGCQDPGTGYGFKRGWWAECGHGGEGLGRALGWRVLGHRAHSSEPEVIAYGLTREDALRIAAANEMAEALEAVMEDDRLWKEAARAALKKATCP